jgi:hypothetical protein
LYVIIPHSHTSFPPPPSSEVAYAHVSTIVRSLTGLASPLRGSFRYSISSCWRRSLIYRHVRSRDDPFTEILGVGLCRSDSLVCFMHNSVPVENCSCVMSAPSIGPAFVSAHCRCNAHCLIHDDLGFPVWSKVESLHSLFVSHSVPFGRRSVAQVLNAIIALGFSSGTNVVCFLRLGPSLNIFQFEAIAIYWTGFRFCWVALVVHDATVCRAFARLLDTFFWTSSPYSCGGSVES